MRNGKPRGAMTATDPGPVPPARIFCKHCSAFFPAPVPIIGQPPEMEFLRSVGELAMHMQKEHMPLVQLDLPIQTAFAVANSALMVMNHFNVADADMNRWRDRERHKIFCAALRESVSDERIESKVRELVEHLFDATCEENDIGIRQEMIDGFTGLVKSMRDAIEERDLYPDLHQPQSVVFPV
jgi:hypothetical protein